jgi:hypothetical protein
MTNSSRAVTYENNRVTVPFDILADLPCVGEILLHLLPKSFSQHFRWSNNGTDDETSPLDPKNRTHATLLCDLDWAIGEAEGRAQIKLREDMPAEFAAWQLTTGITKDNIAYGYRCDGDSIIAIIVGDHPTVFVNYDAKCDHTWTSMGRLSFNQAKRDAA